MNLFDFHQYTAERPAEGEQQASMETSDILAALADMDRLPVAALRLAIDRRDALLPVFLNEIQSYFTTLPLDTRRAAQLFYIFHILGTWAETSAYPLLAKFLASSPTALSLVLGDAVSVTSHRVMAAVFNGDLQPLRTLILDPNADQVIRCRMFQTMAMVALEGKASRCEVVDFLRTSFSELKPQRDCLVWLGWQSAISMLGLSDLVILVKQAFDRGRISKGWLSYEQFISDLQKSVAGRSEDDEEFAPFGDVVDELSSWDSFSESTT